MAKLNLKMAALDVDHKSQVRTATKSTQFIFSKQTSEVNMVAQVPIHQHTTGLVILPSPMPWQILYSSVPPIWLSEKDIKKK